MVQTKADFNQSLQGLLKSPSVKNTPIYYPISTGAKIKENLTRFEIYKRVGDETFKDETDVIQQRHKQSIIDKIDGLEINKVPYQNDKIKLLYSTTFSTSDRYKDFKPLGIICLDIDENDKETLNTFLKRIKNGDVKNIEAAALSVSGVYNGSFWCNIKYQTATQIFDRKGKVIGDNIPKELKKVLDIKSSDWKNTQDKIHKAYHSFLSYSFDKAGIKVGTSKDYNRLRYLSYDPNIYVNPDSNELQLSDLLNKDFLNLYKKLNKEVKVFEQSTFDINETNAFKFALKYAINKGFSLSDGEYHNYINRFSIACNFLGVEQIEVEQYVSQVLNIKVNSNCISFPYQRYNQNFGRWTYKLKPKEINADLKIYLKKDEKLSKKSDIIINYIKEQSKTNDVVKVDLKSGMGSGKSFAITNTIAPELTKFNGCKSVIVLPLNAKTEKDSNQYNLPMITGEALHNGDTSLSDIINENNLFFCNQNTFPRVADYAEIKGLKLNVFSDESQTIVNGQAYKPQIINAFWQAAKRIAKVNLIYSGTPKPYFTALGFHRIDVVQENRPIINIVFRNRLKNIEKTVLEFINEKKQDIKDGKILMFKIQDKKMIDRIKQMLLPRGYKDNEVVVLYSENHIKISNQYQKFKDAKSDEQSFDNMVKIVLVTSFVNEGIDIYSDREIIPINIEKNKTFDVDNFMQFPDRWRTNKNKTYYSFHPEDEEQKTFIFNASSEYKELLDFWTKETLFLNEKYKRAKGLNICEYSKTTISDSIKNEDKYLYFDREKKEFIVNEIELMAVCEKTEKSRTTLNKGIQDIKIKFPYTTITDERKEVDNEPDYINKEVNDIKEIQKTKRQLAETKIHELYKNNLDTFLQAISHITIDTKIKFKTPITNLYSVEPLIEKYPDLFKKHLKESEHFAKRFYRLIDLNFSPEHIEELIFKFNKNIEGYVLKSHRAFSDFVEDYTLHLSLNLYRVAKDIYRESQHKAKTLQFLQVREVRRFLNIIDDVEKVAKDGIITPEQIYKIVFKRYKNGAKIRTHISQKKAVEIVGYLFKMKRGKTDKNGKRENIYIIESTRKLEDVFNGFKNEKEFKETLFSKIITYCD